MQSLPRPEYPRPQFRRQQWLNLNGHWQFEVDSGNTGLERGLLEKESFSRTILVPFCPESTLSGIGEVDFMQAVWYRREVVIPRDWSGQAVLIHFQAVDYDTTVWVNGMEVGRHRGGFTSFSFEISKACKAGDAAVIVVRARDLDLGSQPKPAGKQSMRYGNFGCFYTRTTGIWQTVWLEPVPPVHLLRPRITPSVGRSRFLIEQPLSRNATGYRVTARLSWDGKCLGTDTVGADADFAAQLELTVPEEDLHLWGPGEGNLYDIVLELRDAGGALVDRAESYAGLRSVTIEGKTVKINGRTIFQRQVLDQGFYEDGIMTAPDDAALIQDIRLSMDLGFNAARLSQKVAEERFYYHADRMGYMVWAEFADWGMWGQEATLTPKDHNAFAACAGQWMESIERDYSHPSIVGWCGLCESAVPDGRRDRLTARDDLMAATFRAAKIADRTRPVIAASGFTHRMAETDILDVHDYEQDPGKFAAMLARGILDKTTTYKNEAMFPWVDRGQPFFVSEFGGIKWNPDCAVDDAAQEVSWGYGEPPRSQAEFLDRLEGLCRAIVDNPAIFGFCYTQLTDTFQEQNGLYTFDRKPKFPVAALRRAITQPSAIEGA